MAIYLIVLMCLMNHIAFSGSRVVVSLYALELGATQMTIGLIMALYALCPMMLAVYIGKLADRVGPRLPMLIGTGGITMALFLPPFFSGLLTLYILALLIGTSFHSFHVTVTGITGGIGTSENRLRNYAMVALGFSGASFVGPVTAGFSIDHFGHIPTFMLLAGFTLIPLLLLSLKTEFLPNAVKHGGADEKRKVMDLWRISGLRNTLIAGGIISSAHDLFNFYMPVYGHAIGLTASAIGMVIGFCSLAAFIIRVLVPRLAKISTESNVLKNAIFVAACSFLLFPFFQNAYILASIAFLLGLGCGVGQPMSMSLLYSLSPHGRVAESSGLRVAVNNFTHIVVPLFFGSLGATFGFFPVFLSNSLILVTGGYMISRSRIPKPGA